jgi:outer membrane protein OmpA-like peptidoglycan-associated protein
LKNLDPEATVGVEYWITKNIGVYARGMMGFININEKDPGLWFNEQMLTSDISNYAFQAGITIGFPAAENTSEIDTSEKSAAEIIDTDGDSVIDKIDKCPTLFGSRDNLGCPDMILYYSNTDAVLDSTDMLNLDKVAAFLMDNPKLKIIIEAHTGTSGDSIYNQAASQRRAELSLDYLASKGISKKRMKAVGYGEQYAIGNDDTDITGKSWSKRVFIRIARK